MSICELTLTGDSCRHNVLLHVFLFVYAKMHALCERPLCFVYKRLDCRVTQMEGSNPRYTSQLTIHLQFDSEFSQL